MKNQSFRAQVARVRLNAALNPVVSINAFVQVNSATEDISGNIRLRYNPSEGTNLYLVYNEDVNSSNRPDEPRLPALPRSQARTILLKYSYTFTK